MRNDKFEIWITIDHESPDLEDFNKAHCELTNMNIRYEGKLGIGLTVNQWANFLKNISRFENRFTSIGPNQVMGFPVRIIEERKN